MPRIYIVFIFLSLVPIISSAANVKKYFITMPTDIVVRKDFAEATVMVQDSVAVEKNEKKVIDCFTDKSNFMGKKFSPGSHILVNMDEDELDLGINSIRGLFHGRFRPAIIYDIGTSRNFFGLVNVEDISRFAPDIDYSETPTLDILNYYPIPVEATVIYAICPPDRKGFCKVTMKAKGSLRPIELNAIAQSRLAYDRGKSLRLLSCSDTPQGVYLVSAIMYPLPEGHPVFGVLPRIDVDGSSCDVVLAPLPSVIDSLVPARAKNDYKLNEWLLACALGRCEIRLHADPTPGYVADTSKPRRGEGYYYDQVNRIYYRTSGCINLGNEGLQQLVLEMNHLFDDKGKYDKDGNYIRKIRESERVFLIVLDSE